jgi:hypothetical protein
VKNLYDLLPRRNGTQNLLTQRLVLDLGDEVFRDLIMDIGLEQRQADLAQGISDVCLRDAPMPAEILEDVLEFVGKL